MSISSRRAFRFARSFFVAVVVAGGIIGCGGSSKTARTQTLEPAGQVAKPNPVGAQPIETGSEASEEASKKSEEAKEAAEEAKQAAEEH